MNVVSEALHETKLVALAAQSSNLMRALKVARGLGLSSWCIGAGAIRNLVWDHLHSFTIETSSEDIDLVFFDASDLSPELEQQLEAKLSLAEPSFNWEVVNQAAVHLWLKSQIDLEAKPFQSLAEGIASWPEVATCVGITLTEAEKLEVVAPHGLTDLFEMVVRWNPTHVSRTVFTERVAQKRFDERWPRVKVLIC